MRDLMHQAKLVLARLELANSEGDPIASALLPEFRKAIDAPSVPAVDVQFTCSEGLVHGSTSAKVKRVSWHDDGTLCIELDEWPQR